MWFPCWLPSRFCQEDTRGGLWILQKVHSGVYFSDWQSSKPLTDVRWEVASFPLFLCRPSQPFSDCRPCRSVSTPRLVDWKRAQPSSSSSTRRQGRGRSSGLGGFGALQGVHFGLQVCNLKTQHTRVSKRKGTRAKIKCSIQYNIIWRRIFLLKCF